MDELKRRHDERVALGEHPHIHQSWLYQTPIPDYACSEPLELAGELLSLDTTQPGVEERAYGWVQGQVESAKLA